MRAAVFALRAAGDRRGHLCAAACGLPFSIPAAVGFIALWGGGAQRRGDGVRASSALLAQGDRLQDALRAATKASLRPIVTTALVAAIGFLPMAIRRGPGPRCSGRWPRWSSAASCLRRC